MPVRTQLPHIYLPATIERASFTPVTGFDPDRPPLTARQQRYLHANKLTDELNIAVQKRLELIQTLQIPEGEVVPGVCLDVEGSADQPLAIDALEDRGSRTAPIELLNVHRKDDGSLTATIFIPEKRLGFFQNKITRYGDESIDRQGTRGSTVSIDSFQAFKLSDLPSFWMEGTALPQDKSHKHVWEVWLRKGSYDLLKNRASNLGIEVSEHSLKFHECEICLINSSLQTLAIIQMSAAPLADAKIIDIDFFQVAFDSLSPTVTAGLATGFQTFGAEADGQNNLKVFPYHHGEDLCVDPAIAGEFRKCTAFPPIYPNGMGAGTWIMREQILRSVSNPYWVFAGRDNEHYLGNSPIKGVMEKFGSLPCTEEDSAVLELDVRANNLKPRWGVVVEKEDLPTREDSLEICPNNFLTRWSSEDGKQQIVMTFRRSASTFEGQPVVWVKIKSNGNLPEGEMLKEVLASLLAAGCEEISSPERRWGIPLNMLNTVNDLSHIFGGPVPVMHIHLNNEPTILAALLQMGLMHRKFGHYTMLSGVMNLKEAPHQEIMFGKKLPDATQVHGLNPMRSDSSPFFYLAPRPK